MRAYARRDLMSGMNTQVNPAEALVVVDVQRAFVRGAGALPDAARLVDRTAELIARARAAGAYIVHVQNDGAGRR